MFLRIKKLREERGLSQKELALQMETTLQSTISNWESEVALPRTRDLPLLAKVLGCTIGELFEQEEKCNG